MPVKLPILMEKKGRKAPAKQTVPSHPGTAREVMFSSAEIGASPERTAAFDPRLFLTKLATGKSCREYRDKQTIFSQGDEADAVFYIESGKVSHGGVHAWQRSRGCHSAGRQLFR